ncbi:hypothetical protein TREMEDRAFT_55881, partial [Tremella mesenterica DSM 1558]|uniref:uncharacterized protein n=1 Tax=Tremella mesenterica (strain ATCC 24925 / CBS 8224 / DSM 1558 / NBRC 9311 / NRRL Y-6157 / RJB 2259-6 / UBC 559-6) TaxID=578456 RepID=UPI0003F4A5BA
LASVPQTSLGGRVEQETDVFKNIFETTDPTSPLRVHIGLIGLAVFNLASGEEVHMGDYEFTRRMSLRRILSQLVEYSLYPLRRVSIQTVQAVAVASGSTQGGRMGSNPTTN